MSKKKRKRAKKYVFKLSYKQAESLRNYCAIKSTTPNKLIKTLLDHYTKNFTNKKIGIEAVDEKQLNLFEEKQAPYEQLGIFDIASSD